jgi:2-polyprenyl-3-methyl-5-hydroxy-6-metoxy-1,4-benzoquinol methylase
MKTLVIVTGASGSGKTTYCNNLEKPCIRFDNIYDYEAGTLDFEAIHKWVRDNQESDLFLLDGFIYGLDPKLEKIKAGVGDILDQYVVHMIYMDPAELHETQKRKHEAHPLYRAETINNEVWNREANLTNLNSFLMGTLEIGKRGCLNQIRFYKREGSTFHDRGPDGSEAAGIVEKELLWFVDSISGDPEYQTIELRGQRLRKGYSLSWQSWDHILNTGIDFKGKTVCDIGPFNGFFSIKASKAAAKKVFGYDENGAAIRIARRIANLNFCWNCEFDQRRLGEPNFFDKQFDVILALNMLHHIEMNKPDIYPGVLDEIFSHCQEVVFEVNQDQIDRIIRIATKHGFCLIAKENTHRVSKYGLRFDLLFRRGK